VSEPLAGLRVVALEQAVAAPFCTRRLAEAGANVVKVERPEGDFARFYDSAVHGESAYFVWLNYGKRSIVVDLRTDDGKKTLTELITHADVFVQNLKPGSLSKLGFDLQSLHIATPKLISCSIAGYASSGPSHAKKAYDLLIQAETGLASITGSPQEPGRVGGSICDIACGMFAYDAILLALIERGLTGKGKSLEVTLFDALAQWMAVPYLLERYSGRAPERVGIAHPGIAPYGVFVSRDSQPFVLSIQNEREWHSLCEVLLEQPDWVTDPRTASNEARVANRALVDEAVGVASSKSDFAELSQALLTADIAHAPVNDVSALKDHPDFRTRRVTLGDTSIEVPISPAGSTDVQLRAVPRIGEHTAEVLAELKLLGALEN